MYCPFTKESIYPVHHVTWYFKKWKFIVRVLSIGKTYSSKHHVHYSAPEYFIYSFYRRLIGVFPSFCSTTRYKILTRTMKERKIFGLLILYIKIMKCNDLVWINWINNTHLCQNYKAQLCSYLDNVCNTSLYLHCIIH